MKQRALDLAPRLSVIDPGEARADAALTARSSYIDAIAPNAGEPSSQATVAAGTPARSDIVVAVRDPYTSLHDADSLTNLRSPRPSFDPDGESMTSPYYGGPSPDRAGIEPLAVDELKRYLFGDDANAARPAPPVMPAPPPDETGRRRRTTVPASEHTEVRARPGVDTTAPLQVSSAGPAFSTRTSALEEVLPSMIIAPDPVTRVPSSHAWARLTTKITRRPSTLGPSKPRPSGLVAAASVLFTTAALILVVAAFVRSNTGRRVPTPLSTTTAIAVRPPPSLVIAPPAAIEPPPSEAAPSTAAPAPTVVGAKAKADRRGPKRAAVPAPSTSASAKERSVEQMLEELGDEQLRR